MTHVPALTLGLLMMSCGHKTPESFESTAQAMGRYLGNGQVQLLELAEDGTYECAIFNGLADEGCATVIGAGESRGTWYVDAGAVRFSPAQQSRHLLVDFAEATASPSKEGITLAYLDAEYPLKQPPAPVKGPRRLAVEWKSAR